MICKSPVLVGGAFLLTRFRQGLGGGWEMPTFALEEDDAMKSAIPPRNPPFRIALASLIAVCAAAAHANSIVDSDHDGVSDELDRCPFTLGDRIVGADGCARPPDGDGDRIPDLADACPLSPAGASVDDQGCALDGDFDGIADGLDRCPSSLAQTGVDESGCSGTQAPRVLAQGAASDPNRTEPVRLQQAQATARVEARSAASAAATRDPVVAPARIPSPIRSPLIVERSATLDAMPAETGRPATTVVRVPAPHPALPVAAGRGPVRGAAYTPRVIEPPPPLPGVRYLTLYFEPSSAKLVSPSIALLRSQPPSLAAELKARPQASLIVVGHADPHSDGDRAALAAARRAESVHQQLVQLGVPAERITVRSSGVSEPRFAGGELALNCRVELYLYDPGAGSNRNFAPGGLMKANFPPDAAASIAFPPYSALLDQNATRALDRFLETRIAEFQPNRSVRVRLSGLADPGETAMPAGQLARGRAQAVRNYLVSAGLRADLVELDPVPAMSRAYAGGGRRVELRLVGG